MKGEQKETRRNMCKKKKKWRKRTEKDEDRERWTTRER
jgi:hypothetical protein